MAFWWIRKMMNAPLMMDKKVIWHGMVGDGHFIRDLTQGICINPPLYIEKCAAQHFNT